VHPTAVDLRRPTGEPFVEQALLGPPVEPVDPVCRELAEVGDARAVRPAGAGDAVGPPGATDAVVEVGECLVVDLQRAG